MKKIIHSKDAPEAIGPYSQAVANEGKLIFTSGQIGIDPATEELVTGGVKAQTERALKNLAAVLEAGLSSMERVIKCTVFLADINDFAAVNEVYAGFFGDMPPARSALQAVALPKGALVEIECIASGL